MSLTDLKRKKPKQIIKPVSVDDFIEDANNYALGKASLLAAPTTHTIVKGLDKNRLRFIATRPLPSLKTVFLSLTPYRNPPILQNLDYCVF